MYGNSSASTSKSRAAVEGEFSQQKDFLSFADVLDDEQDGGTGGRGNDGRNGAFRRGTKRSIGEVLQDKGKRRLQDVEKTTPWATQVDWDSFSSATEQLSAEIKAFAQYISPTDQEHDLRECVVESVRRLIVGRWRDAKVHAFGSFETRLYLPTGDIDLVVLSPSIPSVKPQQKKVLYAISGLLTSSGVGRDVVVIAKAKVPIVKFVSMQGGFKIDISLNMTNGINVGKRVGDLFKQVGTESARALVLSVKAFLNQRNMNEVYSGGLGSYSIICLVVSFLQLHPKLQSREMEAYDNLGTLLIEFLEVYGKNFNFDDVGICLSGGGSYYSKSRRGWSRPNQPYLLSIEDPADPTNDVSGGSHNILAVRQSLAGAFEVLTASMYYRTSIILARIAAVQSGVQLNTLSGRAIPHASGEEGENIDECRKSLLGAILGVTTEIERSRKEVKALSETGRVQRSLGLLVAKYDQYGIRPDSRAPRRQDIFRNDRPSALPTKLAAPSHQAALPAKPAMNGSDKPSLQKKPSDTKEGGAGPVEPKSQVIELISSPEPAHKRTKTGKGYIDLDSPSPEPEADDSDIEEVPQISEESRYSVKKAKQPTQPEKVRYIAPETTATEDSEAGEASDEDSSLVLSPDAEEDQRLPHPPQPRKGLIQSASTNGKSRPSPVQIGTRTRSMSQGDKKPQGHDAPPKGKSNRRSRRYKSKKAKASDMEISDDSPPSRPPLTRAKSSNDPTKPAPRRNSGNLKMSQQMRKDYWTSKGSRDPHAVDSDSSDEAIWVRSK